MPVELSDIIQSNIIVAKETSVKSQELSADECCKWKCRERLRKQFEGTLVVFGAALAFEAVHAVHIVCFMVAAVQEECRGVQPLVGIQEKCNFSGPRASVYKVAVE